MGLIGAVGRFFWERLPARMVRVSSTLGVVLSDGAYCMAWPAVGALAPALTLAAGIIPALLQDRVSVTDSLPALVVFALVSALGGGFSFYTLLGYASVDFARAAFGESWRHSVLAARPFAYLVHATLLFLVPLAIAALRHELWRLLRLQRTAARAIAQSVLQGVLVFAWAQAAAFMIRPLWSFYGYSPDVPSIALLQHGWLPLVGVAAVAAAGRVFVEVRAARLGVSGAVIDVAGSNARRSAWVAVPLQAALMLALIAGLLDSWWEAALAYLALLLPLALQWRAARFAPIAWLSARIPLLVRLAATAASAVAVGAYVVEPAAGRSSFTPMLVGIVGALFVSAVLLPREYA